MAIEIGGRWPHTFHSPMQWAWRVYDTMPVRNKALDMPESWLMGWGVGDVLKHVGYSTQEPHRPLHRVWKSWQGLVIRLASRSYIQTVLWGKLLVRARYQVNLGTTCCPLCGELETIELFEPFVN